MVFCEKNSLPQSENDIENGNGDSNVINSGLREVNFFLLIIREVNLRNHHCQWDNYTIERK